MPAISIIVPVYKVEKYLNRCIDSILAQSFPDFELILVDDGSPDKSGKICDDYAAKDSRIKVIHKENGGLSSARNAGLDMAAGSYVGFVDSDDWIDSDMYKVLYENIVSTNSDISECCFVRVKSDSPQSSIQTTERIVLSGNEALIELYSANFYGSVVCVNKLYRKDLFEKLRFPVGKINEDQYLTPKLYHQSDKIVFTNYIGYFYYCNENSITQSQFSLKKLDAVYSYRDTRNYYIHNNLKEALACHDATYCFVLLKYIKKLKEFDRNSVHIKELKHEFDRLFFSFLRCNKLSMKSKLLLIFKRIIV